MSTAAASDLARAFEAFRTGPFPPDSHDPDLSDVYDDLIEYDAFVAGHISGVLTGSRSSRDLPAPDPQLRARVEALADEKSGKPGFLAQQYLHRLDEIDELLKLAGGAADPEPVYEDAVLGYALLVAVDRFERLLRARLGTSVSDSGHGIGARQIIELAVGAGILDSWSAASLGEVLELRNRIAHGGAPIDADLARFAITLLGRAAMEVTSSDVIPLANTRGEVIRSVEDWLRVAPPSAGKRHWKAGHSAMELARLWTLYRGAPVLPPELARLLDTAAQTSGFRVRRAVPEYETRFDKFAGRGRVHDLLLWGEASGGETIVSVEAKAGESFGRPLAAHTKAVSGSNIPARTQTLARALFGSRAVTDDGQYSPEIARVRYQLVSGAAGAAVEASRAGASQAVIVVHEFTNGGIGDRERSRNDADLNHFVASLDPESPVPLRPGALAGPFRITSRTLVRRGVDLYIGKALTRSPSRSLTH